MTHRGPFQPRTFCDSVTLLARRGLPAASAHRLHSLPSFLGFPISWGDKSSTTLFHRLVLQGMSPRVTLRAEKSHQP